MEEFQEFEILWPDRPDHQQDYNGTSKMKKKVSPTQHDSPLIKRQSTNSSSVVPVRIPARNSCFINRQESHEEIYNNFDEGEEEEDKEEMVPPHLMVNHHRRFGGNRMEFSVCTGNGRTLKGRDLSQVRNSILRMTGFIETC